MAASDPIRVSRENQLEQQSLRGIAECLDPWRCTWLDQRDDFSRDGCVQLVDQGRASPLTCWVQAKGHGSGFSDLHGERFESRHLALWADDFAQPLLLAVWSRATRELRIRTAREAVAELTSTNPDWRAQETVTVRFGPEHAFNQSDAARTRVARRLLDESDRAGGVEAFHRSTRRVVLTYVYSGRMETSTILTTDNGPTVVLGPGWSHDDLDPKDVYATRLLTCAAFMFEEVWIPLGYVAVTMATLGSEWFFRLLKAGRLVPFFGQGHFGFGYMPKQLLGEPLWFSAAERDGGLSQTIDAQIEQAKRHLGKLGDILDPVGELARRVRLVEMPRERVLDETRNDLKDPAIRQLLGLRPEAKEAERTEPIWDAPLVNRVLELNEVRAVAAHCRADVIHFEGGMSRIASHKDFSRLRFDRLFPSVEAFDGILRQAGAPDIGVAAVKLGVGRCLEAADSEKGQDFRDWFWSGAASLVGSGGDIKSELKAELQKAFAEDLRSLRLPLELKLRFAEAIGATYRLGSGMSGQRIGYSTRSERGRAVLRRQAANHARRRKRRVSELAGRTLDPYDWCLCGRATRYRFCCGRRVE